MKSEAIRAGVHEPHLQTSKVKFGLIVAAVDLSPDSERTVAIAADIAKQFKSRLFVIHVLPFMPSGSFAEMAALQKRMNELTDRPLIGSQKAHSRIAQGNVTDEIERFIREQKADLLVLGTRGRSKAEKVIFGSTAEALLRGTGIPVLTVGPHVRMWGEPFRSILLPTDLSLQAFRAAQYAAALAQQYAAALNVLHVLHVKKEDEKEEEPAALQEEALSRMQQLVPEDAGLWCRPSFSTETGEPAEVILATAQKAGADLIVLKVTHSRALEDHMPWSVTSQVIQKATCPVLTVRDQL